MKEICILAPTNQQIMQKQGSTTSFYPKYQMLSGNQHFDPKAWKNIPKQMENNNFESEVSKNAMYNLHFDVNTFKQHVWIEHIKQTK